MTIWKLKGGRRPVKYKDVFVGRFRVKSLCGQSVGSQVVLFAFKHEIPRVNYMLRILFNLDVSEGAEVCNLRSTGPYFGRFPSKIYTPLLRPLRAPALKRLTNLPDGGCETSSGDLQGFASLCSGALRCKCDGFSR